MVKFEPELVACSLQGEGPCGGYLVHDPLTWNILCEMHLNEAVKKREEQAIEAGK